jgi:DNA-binding XRE family transcriptional regulator
MDQWDFKKWRKRLGINQVEAGEVLGLSRAAVQYWESNIRPVPRAVELACRRVDPPGVIRAARNPGNPGIDAMELVSAVAHRVADEHPISATLSISVRQNARSIRMASNLHDITLGFGKNSLRGTLKSLGEKLSGYFVRYRLALYLLSVAAVALGVAVSWNWLTAAALFRVVAALPCALMMFRCVRHGTRGAPEETMIHPEAGHAR